MLNKSKIKYIQSLGQKKVREQEKRFIAEGPKLIADLLIYQKDCIETIYALPDWADDYRNLLKDVELTIIDAIDLEKISQLQTPNQVLAVVKQFSQQSDVNTANKIVLALDGIQDPGNLGTIIRTADWFGIKDIVCSTDSAEQYNPKVVQATMGSIARVQVHYLNLPNWLQKVKAKVPVMVTALQGDVITKVGSVKEGIIVVGNEGKGVSDAVMKLATHFITIPRVGEAESLNAAVATGIVLSHLV